MRMKIQKGFTLVELLIVMGILAILAVVATSNYFAYRNRVNIDGEGSKAVEYFREAITRARSQQDGVDWAIHIDNGASDYYELLSGGATGTPVDRIYLSSGVAFTATTSSSTVTLTGGPTIAPVPSQINIGFITTDEALSEEIIIGTNGKVTRTKSY
ncbi:MAG: hypothetical protein A2119_00365 [Candidatus Colwellbacteria bacterium GWA2_46_10]|uniref:General secretion pathway GspH domain-containing protein n=2 Tax=Parcubacteria group TaxID=1794811 RepID=A0A1G1YW98_9BACT|nr:MAG: hypothetical protein A2119_00365 [Candidatus Colwellbacteria bacterium GWA2_46_10]